MSVIYTLNILTWQQFLAALLTQLPMRKLSQKFVFSK